MDLFIEQNFLMNLIVLSLTHTFSGSNEKKHYIRRIASAVFGAVMSAVIVVCFNYMAFVVMTAILLVPSMILIAFGWGNLRKFLSRIALSWLSMILLGGIASALSQLTGMQVRSIYVGVLSLMIARMLVATWIASLRRQEQQLQVSLVHNGTTATCVGLYDSGNRLCMPQSGEPVHIISHGMLMKLGVDEQEKMEIPFRALGTDQGQIQVIRIEKMYLKSGKKSRCCEDVWMGCAGIELLKCTDYQVIVNSAVHLW